MTKAGLNTVFLVAPTSSPERIRKIAQASTGFLYAVSRTGVTGEQQELSCELKDFLRLLRKHTDVPIAVGFGISRPEHVRAVWQEADGAVVGSAMVREIEEHAAQADVVDRVAAFTQWLKGAGMTIEDWRAKIDASGPAPRTCFSERAECVLAVGKIKSSQNMEVFDPEREQQIIRNILRENKGPLDDDALRRIFERVIDECRRIEHQ